MDELQTVINSNSSAITITQRRRRRRMTDSDQGDSLFQQALGIEAYHVVAMADNMIQLVCMVTLVLLLNISYDLGLVELVQVYHHVIIRRTILLLC
jgi:hypothetical protein